LSVHDLWIKLTVGLVKVTLEYSGPDGELAQAQMEALAKPLRGIAKKEDIELLAKLLNGPTMDQKLNRAQPRPCGCKDKLL